MLCFGFNVWVVYVHFFFLPSLPLTFLSSPVYLIMLICVPIQGILAYTVVRSEYNLGMKHFPCCSTSGKCVSVTVVSSVGGSFLRRINSVQLGVCVYELWIFFFSFFVYDLPEPKIVSQRSKFGGALTERGASVANTLSVLREDQRVSLSIRAGNSERLYNGWIMAM